jgi:hypothetical protein
VAGCGAVAATGLAALAVACSAAPPGGLEVIIQTDLPAGTYDGLQISVARATSPGVYPSMPQTDIPFVPLCSFMAGSGCVDMPARLPIQAGTNAQQGVQITVVALNGSNPGTAVVTTSAQVVVPTNEVEQLTLYLLQSCGNCESNKTCTTGGTCEVVTMPALTAYTGGDSGAPGFIDAPTATDGSVPGRCATSASCAPGQTCIDGVCETTGTTADAGKAPDAAQRTDAMTSNSTCAELMACCPSVDSAPEQAECQTIAAMDNSAACAAGLTMLTGMGFCGGAPTQCPTTAPTSGSPCTSTPQTCGYGSPEGNTTCTCSGGEWSCSGTTCVPETCAQQGFQCAPPGATDGCGNPLSEGCETCPTGTCTASGMCSTGACMPSGGPCGPARPTGCCAPLVCSSSTGPGTCGTTATGSGTELASGLTSPLGIAVSSTQVYFTSGTSIDFVPINGGAMAPLYSGGITPAAVAVDDENVYWVDVGTSGSSNGKVMQQSLSTGTTTTLAANRTMNGGMTQANTWGFIALDATYVYWTEIANGDGTAGTVMRAPIGGGSLVTMASNQKVPQGVAVNATDVYWGDASNGGQELLSLPLSDPGGSPSVVKQAGNFNPFGLAVDSSGLYWTDQSSSTVEKLVGGAVSTIGNGAGGLISGIAIDSANVYWTDQASGGVKYVSKAGAATVSTLASGTGPSHGIAVDATSVYWTNNSAGTVMKIPVP